MSTYTLQPGYCAEVVSWRAGTRRYCERKGPHKEDGKEWCGQHVPSLVKARTEARVAKANTKWIDQSEYDMRRARRQKAGEDALALLEDMIDMERDRWPTAEGRAQAILDTLKKGDA